MGVATEITGLIERTVGGDCFSPDSIESHLASDAATVLVLATGPNGETEISVVERDTQFEEHIVGASIARVFPDVTMLSEHPYVHTDPGELLSSLDLTADAFPVGSVLTSCIAPAYQGEGFGRKLTQAALGELLERDVTPILQFEWDRPDSPGVEKLKAAGYTPLLRLEDHFPAGWDCPACNAETDGTRCTCDVVVFRL